MSKKKAPVSTQKAPKVATFSSEKIAELIGECAAFLEMEPSEVAWNDFQTWCKEEDKNVQTLQRSLAKVGGYNSVRDAFYPAKPTLNKQEKRTIGRHALVNRREGRQEADREVMLAQIEEFSSKCFKGRVQGFKPRTTRKEIDRVVTLFLSDNHLGADISGLETDSGAYGVVEEARRIAKVVLETANYKQQHRDRTRLIVTLGGDMTEGALHDAREGAPLAVQICRAIHVFTQAIAYLASAFPSVEVFAVSGNHDRFMSRHPGRAIAGKYDSTATILYYSIKTSLEKLGNVKVHIPLTPWVKYKTFGHNVFATHSDTVLNIPYVGSTVNVTKIEHSIDRINATLAAGDRASVVLCGHAHVPLCVQLPNGCFFINNGATKPLDSYVASLGRMSVKNNSQTLYESTPEFAVGDLRFLRVGENEDKDATLDKIIRPFEGL